MTAPVYVINLARSTDRWEHVRRQLDCIGWPYTRFEAVDGDRLAPEQVNRHRRPFPRSATGLSPREVGCYMSHLALWERIADGDDAGAFVFEDDFAACEGLPDVMEAVSGLRFRHPTIVKLTGQIDQWATYFDGGPLTGPFRLAVPYYVPYNAAGYYITKDAARRLAERQQEFHRAVDIDLQFRWETGVDVLSVLPIPADNRTSTVSRASTIQQKRRRPATWRVVQRYFSTVVRRSYSEGTNALLMPVRLLRHRHTVRDLGQPVKATLLLWGLRYLALASLSPISMAVVRRRRTSKPWCGVIPGRRRFHVPPVDIHRGEARRPSRGSYQNASIEDSPTR